MSLVIISLVPALLWAVWHTGLQKFVYTNGDVALMRDFFSSSHPLSSYIDFVIKDHRWWTILGYGLGAFMGFTGITLDRLEKRVKWADVVSEKRVSPKINENDLPKKLSS